MNIRDDLLHLEKQARLLDPPAGKREEIRKKVIDYAEHFLNRIDNLPAFIDPPADRFPDSFPLSEEGVSVDVLLNLLRQQVDQIGLNPASGGHLGYIPGGGLYASALGDFLADVFNRYAGISFTGPGAVRLEHRLLRWMADLFGYPATALGNLTSGGSMANLMAVVCARDASGIKARDTDRAVVYLTEHAHHSIEKALRIVGLREAIVRRVPMDDRFRMDAQQLDRMIITDKTSRLYPLMVVGTAGTTDLGAIDPLQDIGQVCKKHNLWFHVDAAYGGFFILTDEGKEKLKGIESSHSLTVDPHKGLFLPYGTGALLVRQGEWLHKAFSGTARYLNDMGQSEVSPADLSPELTKPFRGLRLWLPLLLHGLRPFRACLQEKLLLARYLHAELPHAGFETICTPELSVVAFRMPHAEQASELNQQLANALRREGKVFVSTTQINNTIVLRAAILSFRTHLRTIDSLLQSLKRQVAQIRQGATAP